MTHILEDMLPDQLLPAWSLLDLRLQKITGFRPFQLLPLLVERRWRLQCYGKEKKRKRYSLPFLYKRTYKIYKLDSDQYRLRNLSGQIIEEVLEAGARFKYRFEERIEMFRIPILSD